MKISIYRKEVYPEDWGCPEYYIDCKDLTDDIIISIVRDFENFHKVLKDLLYLAGHLSRNIIYKDSPKGYVPVTPLMLPTERLYYKTYDYTYDIE